MTENQTNWLELEAGTLGAGYDGVKLPAMKWLEENKPETIVIDFSKPFNKYTDVKRQNKEGENVIKAIIPITHEGIKKVWWLNRQNPIYSDIIRAGKEGRNTLKIVRIGSLQETQYKILKEEKQISEKV